MGDEEENFRLVLSSSEDEEDCNTAMNLGCDENEEVAAAVVDRGKADPGQSDTKARDRLSEVLQNLKGRVYRDSTEDVAALVGDVRLPNAQQGRGGGEAQGGGKQIFKLNDNKLTRGKTKTAKRKLTWVNEVDEGKDASSPKCQEEVNDAVNDNFVAMPNDDTVDEENNHDWEIMDIKPDPLLLDQVKPCFVRLQIMGDISLTETLAPVDLIRGGEAANNIIQEVNDEEGPEVAMKEKVCEFMPRRRSERHSTRLFTLATDNSPTLLKNCAKRKAQGGGKKKFKLNDFI